MRCIDWPKTYLLVARWWQLGVANLKSRVGGPTYSELCFVGRPSVIRSDSTLEIQSSPLCFNALQCLATSFIHFINSADSKFLNIANDLFGNHHWCQHLHFAWQQQQWSNEGGKIFKVRLKYQCSCPTCSFKMKQNKDCCGVLRGRWTKYNTRDEFWQKKELCNVATALSRRVRFIHWCKFISATLSLALTICYKLPTSLAYYKLSSWLHIEGVEHNKD